MIERDSQLICMVSVDDLRLEREISMRLQKDFPGLPIHVCRQGAELKRLFAGDTSRTHMALIFSMASVDTVRVTGRDRSEETKPCTLSEIRKYFCGGQTLIGLLEPGAIVSAGSLFRAGAQESFVSTPDGLRNMTNWLRKRFALIVEEESSQAPLSSVSLAREVQQVTDRESALQETPVPEVSIEEFMATIADQINNPLSAILLALEILLSDESLADERRTYHLRQIQSHARRIEQISSRLPLSLPPALSSGLNSPGRREVFPLPVVQRSLRFLTVQPSES